MSASEAFRYHENLIIKDPVTILLLPDRKYCPSLHDVNNLYEKWKVSTKGPLNGDKMFNHLQQFINNYNCKTNEHENGKCFL